MFFGTIEYKQKTHHTFFYRSFLVCGPCKDKLDVCEYRIDPDEECCKYKPTCPKVEIEEPCEDGKLNRWLLVVIVVVM